MPAISEAFVAEWDAGDALGYCGAILSFIGTVVLGALALYQNRIIKTEADKKSCSCRRTVFVYYNRIRIYTSNPYGLPPVKYRDWLNGCRKTAA